MWRPDALLERLYEEAADRHRETAAAEGRDARRLRLTEVLRRAIGSFPAPAKHGEPELLERVDCGGYIRERVQLSGVDGVSYAAYVLIPKGRTGPLPAVLAIHGHGYGSREITGLLPDGSPDTGPPTCHHHFALRLVERGLLVIAPDVAGFGERMLAADRDKDPRTNSSCGRLATSLLLHGVTLTGFRTAELLASLDYLASRGDVAEGRIGVMGFSGGALLAWVCAALDERLRSIVLTGFPGTFKETIMAVYHCIDNYTPGLLAEAELPEWISLLAPRPLFVESADRDPIFPLASAQTAVRELERIYAGMGAPDRLTADFFPGVHEVSGRLAYDWLASSLAKPAAG